MILTIEIPDYRKEEGFSFKWCDGYDLHFQIEKGVAHLKGNRAGLESLANHLLNLAQNDVPEGYHIHLDEYGSFEDGSSEMIIEKTS